MPQRSADSVGSTFSMRGGWVHTMEKPNPLSAVRISFLVMVNGVRPGVELADTVGTIDGGGGADVLNIDLRRSTVGVCGGGGNVSSGGSSSRKRRNRFSSASRWCIAFLLSWICTSQPGWSIVMSSVLPMSSTLDCENSPMVVIIVGDGMWSANGIVFGNGWMVELILLSSDTLFMDGDLHTAEFNRLQWNNRETTASCKRSIFWFDTIAIRANDYLKHIRRTNTEMDVWTECSGAADGLSFLHISSIQCLPVYSSDRNIGF